jgi:hypothetical protein
MRPALYAGLLAGCALGCVAGCFRSAPPPAPQQAPQPQEAAPANPAVPAAPAAPEPVEEGWADAAKESATIGDLEVRVTGARIGKARVTPAFADSAVLQANDDLIVYLHLKNRSQTEKIRHDGWTIVKYSRPPKLTDDLGKSYRHHFSVNAFVEGVQVWVGSIDPGKETDDIVLFEPPPANSTRLKLELPVQPKDPKPDLRARPIDPGVFRFVIPMNMVKHGDKEN